MNDDHSSPLLSVTVTNYNYARFLRDCFESILKQTFDDYEVIVADNASTDESRQIIADYAARDPRFVPVLHEQNIGLHASVRDACERCRGRLRVHIDADDWVIDPDAFRRQVAMFRIRPDLAFVYSRLAMKGPHGEPLASARAYATDTVVSGPESIEAILGFNLSHTGLMMSMNAYRSTGGLPEGFRHTADAMLALELAEHGSVGYIDCELYAFRQHGTNVHLEMDRHFIRDEAMPTIDAAFSGPLGSSIPDAAAMRRRIERKVLVHGPTLHIFSDQRRAGWRLYWESVKVRPLRTTLQPRSIALLARTVLGRAGYDRLRSVAKALLRRGSVGDG